MVRGEGVSEKWEPVHLLLFLTFPLENCVTPTPPYENPVQHYKFSLNNKQLIQTSDKLSGWENDCSYISPLMYLCIWVAFGCYLG